jgi:hypothetical protein
MSNFKHFVKLSSPLSPATPYGGHQIVLITKISVFQLSLLCILVGLGYGGWGECESRGNS